MKNKISFQKYKELIINIRTSSTHFKRNLRCTIKGLKENVPYLKVIYMIYEVKNT